MQVTIKKDSAGSLHIFKGYNIELIKVSKYLYVRKTNNSESDLFVQSQCDVEIILNSLTIDDRESVINGYCVNAEIDNEYF